MPIQTVYEIKRIKYTNVSKCFGRWSYNTSKMFANICPLYLWPRHLPFVLWFCHVLKQKKDRQILRIAKKAKNFANKLKLLCKLEFERVKKICLLEMNFVNLFHHFRWKLSALLSSFIIIEFFNSQMYFGWLSGGTNYHIN